MPFQHDILFTEEASRQTRFLWPVIDTSKFNHRLFDNRQTLTPAELVSDAD